MCKENITEDAATPKWYLAKPKKLDFEGYYLRTPMDIIQGEFSMIDKKTDDLLTLADQFEKYKINHQLDNGHYLNPVMTIRTKVDVVFDSVQMITHIAKKFINLIPFFCGSKEPVMPGDSMPTLRGDMLEVKSIELSKSGYRIWGERDGEPYIINEGDTSMLGQPKTLKEASSAPFYWFDMDERADQ